MAILERPDPLLGFNFLVSLLDSTSRLASAALPNIAAAAVGGFSECSGLEMTLEVEEYNEGGRNSAILQFPTRAKWSNIVLKRGMGAGPKIWDWHFGFIEGRGRRRDGLIILQNERRQPQRIWAFRRGLPVKYTGPTLNASENSVAIETIEIAHEGFFQMDSF